MLAFQNQRGGRVNLQAIVMPVMEFDHAEKGDALYGEELFSMMQIFWSTISL